MYVIDLDDSIFDTQGFRDFFVDVFANTGRNKCMLLEMIQKSKELNDGVFDFRKWLALSGIKEKEFNIIRDKCPSFVYDDFIDFAKKNHGKINIITYGDKYYQEKKIQKSGIAKYIKSYYVTTEKSKKNEINKIYKKHKEKITYIDNKVYVKPNDFNFDIDILRISRNGIGGHINSLAYI